MEWLKNLSNAIEYIEDNLDKGISYEETARIACYQPITFSVCFPMWLVFLFQSTYANAECHRLLLNYSGQTKRC